MVGEKLYTEIIDILSDIQMDEDSNTKKVKEGRTVLGDVSNLPVKRGFSSVSGVKSRDGKGKGVVAEDVDSVSAKKVCLGVANLVSEKGDGKCEVEEGEKGLPSSDDYRGKLVSVVSSSLEDIQELSNAGEGTGDSPSGCVKQSVEIYDASRDSSVSIDSMPTCSVVRSEDCYFVEESDKGKVTSDVMQSIAIGRDDDVHKVDPGRPTESGEHSTVRTVQGTRGFELEKCTGLKEGGTNTNEDDNLLKGCACSFCLKAAYIWSDLNYQDAKGRIAALKKSQREASILVQNVSKEKEAELQGVGSSSRSSRLETDLTGQWRSLFLHMKDIFLQEINQVQDGLSALKEIRENCKTDLENESKKSDDKH